MEAAEKFSGELGTAPACRVFGVPRASLYRHRRREATPAVEPTPAGSHGALSGVERQEVLQPSVRFWVTMYRILDANQEGGIGGAGDSAWTWES